MRNRNPKNANNVALSYFPIPLPISPLFAPDCLGDRSVIQCFQHLLHSAENKWYRMDGTAEATSSSICSLRAVVLLPTRRILCHSFHTNKKGLALIIHLRLCASKRSSKREYIMSLGFCMSYKLDGASLHFMFQSVVFCFIQIKLGRSFRIHIKHTYSYSMVTITQLLQILRYMNRWLQKYV